jgi:ATP adenylyltransferase
MRDEKPSGCLFCMKAAENCDSDNQVLYRGEHTFVMLNAYPYNPGHLMVVPYAHVDRLDTLADEAANELMQVTRLALRILHQALSPDGMNIGINQGAAAGAGITEHVHQHIVPRWIGDTNFMTTVGETKVLPEMLAQTYSKLAPLFARTREST